MDAVPTIVCVGTVTLDMILLAPRLPNEDERIEAGQVALVGGGNAANSAVAIARLGLAVEFCGTVGDDAAGEMVLDELNQIGVGTDLVRRNHGSTTAQSAVIVSEASGARTIVTHAAPPPPAVPAGFDIVHLDKAGWSVMPPSGIRGSRISVDDGNRIPNLDVSLLTWYVPTAIALRERYGEASAVIAARTARSEGATNVVVTSGGAGSFALDEHGLHFAPALSISPLSTLGAGDVFHGALVAAIALGRQLSEAIRFANVAAALSCRAIDGRSGIPCIDEVEAVLAELPRGTKNEGEIAELFATSSGH
jgi:sulfofructose kinase